MKIKRNLFMLCLFSVMFLVACGQSSADLDSGEAVNLRFDNQTGLEINRLSLGSGDLTSGANTRYTNIGVGEVSDYLPIEPAVSDYNIFNFTHDGDGTIIGRRGPHEFLEIDELEIGTFYTVTIEIDPEDDRDAVITNVSIDDPPE